MRNTRAQKAATELRKRMTDAERCLWRHLRMKQMAGHRFRRQYPIGPYVADFACLEAKLIIEVDGGQHNFDIGVEKDARRTEWLTTQGYQVLRFWNNEVLVETQSVLQVIHSRLVPPS